jgi:CRISPR/Cas system-associated exonuclease Cas4 (RecB family)
MKQRNLLKEKYQDSLDYIDVLHKYLVEKDRTNRTERIKEGRIGKFYPSSIGQCKRRIVYSMLGYPAEDISGQSLLIMENGTSFHERIEHMLDEAGALIVSELPLKNEKLRISGRTDALIWNIFDEDEEEGPEIILKNMDGEEIYKGPNNYVLLAEFKSISPSGFARLAKSKPKKEHEMQLQLYLHETGIKKGLIWYECKSDQDQRIYEIEYNPELVAEILADIEFVNECVEKVELPEREGINRLDDKCRYCPFKEICHPLFSNDDLMDYLFQTQE